MEVVHGVISFPLETAISARSSSSGWRGAKLSVTITRWNTTSTSNATVSARFGASNREQTTRKTLVLCYVQLQMPQFSTD